MSTTRPNTTAMGCGDGSSGRRAPSNIDRKSVTAIFWLKLIQMGSSALRLNECTVTAYPKGRKQSPVIVLSRTYDLARRRNVIRLPPIAVAPFTEKHTHPLPRGV